MPSSNIKILTLTGSSIEPYIPTIARLRLEVFREHPYSMKSDLETEVSALEKYAKTPDSIAVVIFDASTLVGASLGIPFELEKAELQTPFVEQKLPVEEYFYFGKSVLLKSYRGRGIGHHFFDLREEKAKTLKRFSHICFWDVKREEADAEAANTDLGLVNFLSKRGYVTPPDLHFNMKWKDVKENKVCEKKIAYWVKNLVPNLKSF